MMRLRRWFNKSSSWLRLLVHRQEADQALDDEIRSHLDAKTEQYMEQGMTPKDARRTACIELGGVEQVKEQVRSIRAGAWLETFVQDVKFGLRLLRRSPGFTSVAVLILGFGIGANTAIFSIFNGLMLRTLPVPEPGRLVELLHQSPGEPAFNGFSWDAYQIFRDRNHVFSDLIVGSVNFFKVRIGSQQPQTVFGGNVGENFFQALGVSAAAGRLIGPEDVQMGYHTPVAVVSWSFWQSRFNLDRDIVGKKIVVGDDPVTIVGVADRDFYGLSAEARQDIWLPVSMGPSPGWGFALLGRLKPGVSVQQARTEVAGLFQTVVNSPDAGPFVRKMKLQVEPAGHGVSTPLRATLSTPLVVLMVVVSLLLLLTCANLAGLLLARAAHRQHEMAVRACLGARRARLIQQTLTESLLLSMLGTALSMFLAYCGTHSLIRIFASGRQMIGVPVHFEALSKPDWHVLLFTGTLAIMTALLFGAVPAIRVCRPTSVHPLQEMARTGESRSQRLFGKSLVVSQVAVSVVLVSSATLFVSYLSHLRSLNPGFRRDHLLLLTLDTAHSGYQAAEFARLSEQLVARLETIPGVQTATLSSMSPLQGPGASASAFETGHGDNAHNVLINNVDTGYFETYGTRLLTGRYFFPDDQDKSPIAIVNQAAARECFGAEDPIGKSLTLNHITLTKKEITYQVVGVVEDAGYNDLQQAAPPTVYRDLSQQTFAGSQLAVRTRIDPNGVAGAVREVESSVLKTVPIVRITTMNEQIDASIVPERLVATLSGWFGAVGALLAAIGLYGLLAYTVTRRTHEIGVRMALGATRRDAMAMVLHDAMWTVFAGLVVGAPLAFWAKSMAVSLIHGLPVESPMSIACGGAAMIVLGLAAAYVPARRAMRCDPMVALRCE